jgi:hypothetical protein
LEATAALPVLLPPRDATRALFIGEGGEIIAEVNL